jgi:hypothetical protein
MWPRHTWGACILHVVAIVHLDRQLDERLFIEESVVGLLVICLRRQRSVICDEAEYTYDSALLTPGHL